MGNIKAFETEVKASARKHGYELLLVMIRKGKKPGFYLAKDRLPEICAGMGITAAQNLEVTSLLLNSTNYYFSLMDKDDTEKAQELFAQWCSQNPVIKKLYLATLRGLVEQAMKGPDKTVH